MTHRILPLFILGAFIPASASAVVHFKSRFNDYRIGYDTLAFGSATADCSIYEDIQADTAGESGPLNVGVPTGLSGVSWTGDANIGITNVNAGPGVLTADLTATTADQGTIHAVFGGTVSGGLGNFLGTGVVNGRHALEFHGVSPGAVDDHGSYLYLLELKGDWSQAGTGQGQHELLNLNSAWTITNDFVYNSAIDTTFFGVSNADYLNDGLHNVDLDLRLNGVAAVPEPASMLALAAGAIGLIRRRKA